MSLPVERRFQNCKSAILPLLWILSVQGNEQLQQQAERASTAMQRNDFVAAEQEYRAILAIAPQLAEIRSNLGLALHMQDKFELAEKEFRLALRSNPKLFVPNFFLGIQLFKTNRYKEAAARLQAAVDANPLMKEPRYQLGAAYVGLKEYDQAIRQYSEILKQDPREVDALYSIGKIYNERMERSLGELLNSSRGVYYGLMLIQALEGGEQWRSLVDIEIPKIIQSHPDAPLLRYELGRVHLQRGELASAKQLFQEELAIDPWSFQAHYALAQISLASGKYGDFSEDLERAITIRPEFFCPLPSLLLLVPADDMANAIERGSSPLAQQFLAAHLGKPNNFCDGLSAYRKKLAESDKDLQKSAIVLFREKRYEAVIARLANKSRVKPENPSQQLMLAHAYFETGKLESAARIADKLSQKPDFEAAARYLQSRSYQVLAVQSVAELERIAPDSHRAHQLRGEAHFIRKDMRQAIDEFKKALERKPQDAELLYQLGRAHYYLAEFPQAFEALRKSLKLDPFNAEANFIVGEGMVHTQEGERAVAYLQRALELDPQMLKAHGELGKAFLQMNQWENAARELEQAVTADFGGELHYQLFRAYSKLNQKEKAQGALAKSTRLRQEKIERERSKIVSHEQP
ncbi:MAG: tetratricopeptide repeat protein [Acidobacteria bacterium]|nr:tetratricopeptide repeat protein [Acidobacteriota bacterium]